jgi:hypothetical protein
MSDLAILIEYNLSRRRTPPLEKWDPGSISLILRDQGEQRSGLLTSIRLSCLLYGSWKSPHFFTNFGGPYKLPPPQIPLSIALSNRIVEKIYKEASKQKKSSIL